MSSSLGFGSTPWGSFPWGSSDWAEEVLWKTIPEFYRLIDAQGAGRVPTPLRTFIEALKPPLEDLRRKTAAFPDLWNADKAPTDQLAALARNIGLEPTTDKGEIFARLEILNAHQLYLFKGTDKGYRIVASFDGLDVIVEGLWAENCAPGAALSTEDPEYFMANFDDIPADDIHLDSIYVDRFDIWPYELLTPVTITGGVVFDPITLELVPTGAGFTISEGKCRSYSIRLSFFKPDDTEIEDYNNVSKRIVRLVEFMRPIHVRIDSLTFDGPRASASWTQSINGGSPASASWTSSISGLVQASASWTTSVSGN